jgi:alkanesulfonate monooxygenase SsuD/methylene tetrahydromethanopterin reductase-like flavin-dependent oxidoreductase (luciferase family)
VHVGITYLSMSSSIDGATTAEKYRQFFDQVTWANGAGFSGIWITEHHFSTYSISASPLVLLARAATLAPDLRVGTGILVLPLWDPRRLAADVGTLDAITGGRFDLGIGRGYQPHEFGGFGTDLADSRATFEEHVGLLLRLFTEQEVTHDGAFYQVEEPVTVLPRPVQTPHPPVWLAAASPESTKFAVRNGFHHMGLALATPDELGAQWRSIERFTAEAGRSTDDVAYSANRFVWIGTDPDERRAAAREVARQITVSRSLATGSAPATGVAPGFHAELDPADVALAEERLLGGTPDQVVEQLTAIAAAGVTHVNAAFEFGALPFTVAERSARLFAAEVLPAIAELNRPAPVTAAAR